MPTFSAFKLGIVAMNMITVFGMFWNLMTFWCNPFYAFGVCKSDPLMGALTQYCGMVLSLRGKHSL